MHLEPVASETILDEEAHNPARGEELGGSRQIFVANLLLLLVEPRKDSPLLLLMQILVEPPDRLFISGRPRLTQGWCVQQCDQFMQDTGAGEELARQTGCGEEDRYLSGKLVGLPEQEVAIGPITWSLTAGILGCSAGMVTRSILRVISQVGEERLGSVVASEGAWQQHRRLHELPGHQPDQLGEERLMHQVCDSLSSTLPRGALLVHPALEIATRTGQLRQRLQRREPIDGRKMAGRREPVERLKEALRFVGQQTTGAQGQGTQLGAERIVHNAFGHASSSVEGTAHQKRPSGEA